MSYPKSPFSGFPFDDDFDRDRTSFRTQLDDIAQRHPEFAQHLSFGDEFPFRGRRANRPHPEESRRPFGSRFEEFGFPFRGRHFDEPDFYQEGQPPQQYQQEQPHQQQPTEKVPEKQEEVKEQQKEEGEPQKEDTRKQNIQQSNTVDLGKNQEPLDDQRGQRSMSAPPENRPAQQRFVSSINIPIQTQSGGGDMGARASQPEQPQKPTERVIPIHVEGRDEPVLPRNANFTPPPSAPQQQQPPPQAERIFGRNPSHFTQFLNKGEPQATPEEFYKQQQKSYQQKPPQNFQQQQPPQQPKQPPQQQAPQQQEPHQEQQPEVQKPGKPDQIQQIQNIQKDVSELMNQVEKFEGKPKDKQYLYLDEMLTRNLIKLDNIETEGKENIRQARKEAIKCIESCIAILEAKANANEAKALQPASQEMEIDKVPEAEQQAEQPEKSAEQPETPAEQPKEEIKQEETPQENKPEDQEVKAEEKEAISQPEGALEVSGVARSGSVVNTEATPMEVEAEKKPEEKVEEKMEGVEQTTKTDEKPKKKGKKKEKSEKK